MGLMTSIDFDFDSYSELSLQRLMVLDKPRTDAFAEAIAEVVSEGDRVIDVGTGSGLLAMLAAKAGAAHVYGLDRAAIAQVARQLVIANNLDEQVEILHENASRFKSNEKADLIVSEWLGHFAFTEGMLQHVIACRDNNLKPGGRMLPSEVQLLLAPLDAPELYNNEGPGSWKMHVQGLDFSSLEEVEVRQAIGQKKLIDPQGVLAPGQAIVSLDLVTADVQNMWQSGELTFVAQRDGQLHGFAGWFTAQLSPSVCLDTGPHAPPTHWAQTYFPLAPVTIKKGERIFVTYALYQHPISPGCLELELTVHGERLIYTIT